ncbi:hypothetical protein TorRG33x02_271050 [Trema orientale]|uniref:Uncharacterized protein n=1 Tax=Trema orientale TaxID=63057 RepID=A0A2P5CWB5_TREOI|nr:hypothetical protein TorRG33x02_271050 [Trema orientale]
MAARKISDVETIMKMNPNPDENEVKPNPDDNTIMKKEEFKPKTGSVFPAKKRLVKTMMFKYIAEKSSVCFHGGSSSTEPNKTQKKGINSRLRVRVVPP